MHNVTVVVATYGSEAWERLGTDRAARSAADQDCDVVRVHLPDGTLAECRNEGLRQAKKGWLVYLDGDDELAAGYVDEMRVWATGCTLDMFTPRVQYLSRNRQVGQPVFHRDVSPTDGNWLVVGTMVHSDGVRLVGGWEEWPMYEDWALFARLQKTGGRVHRVPNAVYRAHRNPWGRNHQVGRNGKLAAHDMIRRAVFPELYEETG